MKKKITVISGIVIAILVVVIVSVSQSGKISVKDYINDEIKFYGCNGYATVSTNDVFNYELLEQDLGPSEVFSWDDDPVYDYIDVKFDVQENLSNGDVVKATITVNCDSINNFKFAKKLTGKKEYVIKYKVKGLEDAVEIDPFEIVKNIVIDTDGSCNFDMDTTYNKDFEGFYARYYDNGDLQIVDSQSNEIAVITYRYDSGALESTNKVTITTDCNQDKYADNGIIINPTSKEIEPITCEYLSKGDALSVDDFNTLKERAIDEINEIHQGSKYVKSYFGYDKDGNGNGSFWSNGYYNQIKYLFSYNEDGETIYQCVSFYNVKIMSNGFLKNPENIESSIGSSCESIKELESDQKENWQVFSILSVKE